MLEAHVVIHVADQVGQRLDHTGQVLAGEIAPHILVGAHSQEHRVVFVQQRLRGDVAAHLGVEAKLHAHPLEDLATPGHHGFFQLELGYAESQQAADLRIAVEQHRLDACTHQHVSAAQACGARADDRHLFAGGFDTRQVRAPAHGQCGVGNVLLGGADGHGAEAVFQGTGALTEAVLGTDTATDFRQRIGLVGQLRRLENIALGYQFEPIGNQIVDRAFPLAVGVAALQAAVRLVLDLAGGVFLVDFHILGLADLKLLLVRVAATEVDELEIVGETVGHGISPYFSVGRAGGRDPRPWASPARISRCSR